MRGSCITSTSMKLGAESYSPEPSASASPNSLRSEDRFSTSNKLLGAPGMQASTSGRWRENKLDMMKSGGGSPEQNPA